MVTTAQLKKIDRDLKAYRSDPIGFECNCLDVEPQNVWPKMEEVALSVRDNRKTAVKAGHSVSKTYGAGRLALWFLYTFGPRATVVSTAPTNTQVEELLWREIRDAHNMAKVPLGGNLSRKKLDLGEKWFALGFATKPDTATQEASKFAGFHNENILIIFDEASGVLPPIWRATEGLLASGSMVRFLAIGNPLYAFGNFADCFKPGSGYNCITISVLDTPNYQQGREVIPGLAGRMYEREMRVKYGEDSNEYKKRVLGEFPTFTEGTFYGMHMARCEKEGRICWLQHTQDEPVYTFWDIGDVYTSIWFAQFIGKEIRVIDFYNDNSGLGLPEYARVIKAKDYVYGGHYAPQDLWGSNAKNFQTGRMTKDIAAGLGINFKRVQQHRIEDGIEAVRVMLPDVWFDRLRCMEGIDALYNYRKKKNEQLSTEAKTVYYEVAVKDWTCHPADAFRYMAMVYKYGTIGGQRLGLKRPLHQAEAYSEDENDCYDPLENYR